MVVVSASGRAHLWQLAQRRKKINALRARESSSAGLARAKPTRLRRPRRPRDRRAGAVPRSMIHP
jgi:hypothetical protein